MEKMNKEQGTLMMPDGTGYSKDSKVTGLNNNVAVVGPSGCGKSTVMGVLNSLNCGGSCIISDPKGGLYRSVGGTLEKMGYTVMKLDLTHPEDSMHYDPLRYIKNTADIQKLAHTLVYGSHVNKMCRNDPYWDESSETLLCALIGYLFETRDPDMSITKVMKMLGDLVPYENVDVRPMKPVFREFEMHRREYMLKRKTSWACSKFSNFTQLSEKTLGCVISTLTSQLNNFDNEELQKLFKRGHFDFTQLGREKIALFVIVSDTDRSRDIIANLFYSQAMNELCDYADNRCEGGRLPTSVTFILDDFATNCRIDNFENIISNIRARNISTILMLQSLGQLEIGYGDSSKTIINNCDTTIFMGANSTDDAAYFARKANKPLYIMLEMPLYSSWIFRRSEKPRFVKNIVPDEYLKDVNRFLFFTGDIIDDHI